jgi:hypothetical protein
MLKKDGYLQPFVLQLLGIVMLLVFAAVWIVTGHESGLLVGAAVALIGVGSGVGAIVTVRQQIMDKQYDEDHYADQKGSYAKPQLEKPVEPSSDEA